MPMLALASTSWPSTRNGLLSTAWIRSAIATASSWCRTPRTRIVNSSPPMPGQQRVGVGAGCLAGEIVVAGSMP